MACSVVRQLEALARTGNVVVCYIDGREPTYAVNGKRGRTLEEAIYKAMPIPICGHCGKPKGAHGTGSWHGGFGLHGPCWLEILKRRGDPDVQDISEDDIQRAREATP